MLWSTFLSIVIPSVAVLIAPDVSDLRNRRRAKRAKIQADRDQCYQTLFIKRAVAGEDAFYSALNAVPLLFGDDDEILKRWREYVIFARTKRECVNVVPGWQEQADDLRFKLITAISKKTSYQHCTDLIDLREDVYVPQAFTDIKELTRSVPESLAIIAKSVAWQANNHTETSNYSLPNQKFMSQEEVTQ